MAVLKCKMCGGELTIDTGSTICECEYCGSKQTIPGTDDEKRLKLYERANRLRFECEFDKAAGVYEAIIADFQEEAEAYWGLVLCKYGIEYVDDPVTHKKIPTCHRSSFESVMDDANFELVMENSDTLARGLYREEAKRIEEIRKGIIEVSSAEEPYDIFICYKETAEDGQRTIDSVIAQNVYEELTEKGYRVFFSRITLEDKLGQEYEPYIFAALNSAKVMLAFGTSYDYFNAVWVKNEWSRFLQLIAAGQKKTLIPCYKDLDAYDMPKEFKHLQAQDMGKVGAVQDLIRGIDKITERERNRVVGEVKQGVSVASNADQLIKRGHQALEDREWKKADGYFEEALNLDAESAEAFMGKWLSKIHRDGVDGLVEYYEQKYKEADPESIEAVEEDKEHIDSIVRQYEVNGYLSDTEIKKEYRFNRAYESVLSSREKQKKDVLSEINSEKLYLRTKQYARGKLAQDLENAISQITQTMDQRIADAREKDAVSESKKKEEYAEYLLGADEKAKELYEKAWKKRAAVYQNCIDSFSRSKEIKEYEAIRENFSKLGAYEEAEAYITKCDNEIDRLKKELEEDNRRKNEEQERLRLKKAKKRKIILIIAVPSVVLICTVLIFVVQSMKKTSTYNHAIELMEQGKYNEAVAEFESLGTYKDCEEQILESKYLNALSADDASAIRLFSEISGYKDANEQLTLRKLMNKSIKETYDEICNHPDKYYDVENVKKTCERYIKYCGNFKWEKWDTEFTSDICLDNGTVYWLYSGKSPDYTDSSGNKHLFYESKTPIVNNKISNTIDEGYQWIVETEFTDEGIQTHYSLYNGYDEQDGKVTKRYDYKESGIIKAIPIK